MESASGRLSAVRKTIAAACAAAGRDPAEVRLLAVSKRHAADRILGLLSLGQQAFGENYVSEALGKQAEMADADIEWHFIGPVQSNKTRDLARAFHWVQSIDREKILRRLSDQRPASLGPLNVCLQVNIDEEAQKSGAAPPELPALAALAASLPGLRLRGLMCIPRAWDDPEKSRQAFARTRHCFELLRAEGHDIDTLSMGMSGDIAPAIAEGSTMVRVGTALFGPRDPS
ncbi:YggS family pyridoxal phosphate-dependent enzyme [Marinihelvus fidelis]|uniref:Pyridoxal phosphate homeostasis protein n=1 Tax=Marinihelvus fidelis TaxID=2613842 RepID=A0A5N0T4Z4_9GAMM|nr:YggS family pyridoxal phosphate-dependent enzyme [Marinihelvus fidelis]KAA9129554.1 YggS family pyridoxal phosphate-dependent enzyme [Marinihelvus fidelis]